MMLRLGGLAGNGRGSFSYKNRLQFRCLFTQFSITLALIPICNTPKIWYSGRLNKLSGCYGDWYPTQDIKERYKVNIIKIQPHGVLKFTLSQNHPKSGPKEINIGPQQLSEFQKNRSITGANAKPPIPSIQRASLNYLRKRAKSQLSLVRSQV